ncbi:TonB-linked SusC/RagA family outer membrane protein [Mangrovibacterium diazotrophicum]|uniref:TonB-linked SusC/RagA family outer membrane protein n=2 Tax=Mangrovibacterium diazotrophicum TaxID=1261403 RepID=A0A419VYH7_9BACT|nr:TonB-linked SusC/RagA family outer membrane protein [Mangrovibacterium diazotrophicum]
MKKKEQLGKVCSSVKHLLRIMRIVTLLILVGSLHLSAAVYSQQNKINLFAEDESIRDVLKKIEDQTDFKFVYQSERVDVDRKVSVNFKERSIEDILNELLADEGISYVITSKNLIVINPSNNGETTENGQNGEKEVKGRITNENGEAIPGATIMKKGTTQGTITDFDGYYSLKGVKEGETLVFSFVGMKTQESVVSTSDVVNISLAEETIGLNEVVAVGYSTTKKGDLTGSVSTIDVGEIENLPANNLSTALSGRMAGVSVQQNGGSPTAGVSIRIRGTGTLNNNDPLVVVDGIIGADINNVNPNDIESISVLKDAAASAIYGSRAASGVIIVKTKRGKFNQDLKLTFNAYYGGSKVSKKIDVLSASQLATIYNEASDNDGTERLSDYSDPSSMQDLTDWQDEVFRTAIDQNYVVGLSGGSEKSSFNMSFNLKDAEGVLINTYNKRYTFRLNSDHLVGKKFTVGESLSLTYQDFKEVNTRSDNYGAILETLAMHTDIPVYDEDGEYSGVPSSNYGDVENPVGLLERNKGYARNYKLEANVYGQYEILDGLKAKSSYSLTYLGTDVKEFDPIVPEAGRPSYTNMLTQSRDMTINWLWENTLNFDKTYGDHSISAVAGVTAQHWEYSDLEGRRTDYQDEDEAFWYLDAGSTTTYANGGFQEYGLFSFLSRVNYVYANKYLFGATLRADGSSRFTEDNRWGYFPALSLGWRISQESFMADVDWLDDLKLRSSWGILGNQDVDLYQTYSTYVIDDPNAAYYFGMSGENIYNGYYRGSLANENLKWESTNQLNLGLDATLFDQRVVVGLDYFNKKTTDILVNPPVLGVYGTTSAPYTNGGEVSNKGFEAVVTYRGGKQNSDGFRYEVTGNLSTYKNEVLSLGNSNQAIYGPTFRDNFTITRTQVGDPIASFFGYKTDGVFADDAAVSAYVNDQGDLVQPDAQAGDFKFVDVNGDGTISSEDRTTLGSAVPDFSYGLNFSAWFKNFDFSMFFQGVQGNETWYALRYQLGFAGLKYNYLQEIYDRWTPENTNASVPRVTWSDPNNNKRPSDYYVEDGSYLKLKNVTIGYSLPETWTSKLGIAQLRMYVSGQNLFTVTKYPGYDPELGLESGSNDLEAGVDRGQYPQSRSFYFGLNLSF